MFCANECRKVRSDFDQKVCDVLFCISTIGDVIIVNQIWLPSYALVRLTGSYACSEMSLLCSEVVCV